MSNRSWKSSVVSGRIESADELQPNRDDYVITVRNMRTNAIATDTIRSGYFAAAFADLSRRSIVEVGDRLEVRISEISGEVASDPLTITATPEAVSQAFASLRLNGIGRPKASQLLQNYPNPFNPETWIPYQLAEASPIVIRIYDATGSRVRTLNLGHQPAGFYRSRSNAAYWDGKNEAGESVGSGLYFY